MTITSRFYSALNPEGFVDLQKEGITSETQEVIEGEKRVNFSYIKP